MTINRFGKFKVIAVLTLLLMLVFGTVHAMQMNQSAVNNALVKMEGDWYNYDDNLVLAIHDGYINDCKVVSGYDFSGGSSNGIGTFRIQEADGYRNLRIEWHINSEGPSRLLFNSRELHR